MYAVPAKFKLLVFWTSTNAASRQLNPELIQLYQHYRPKGLEIISISPDDDLMAWRKAIEMDGLVWRNGSDLKGRNSDIAKLYMVNTVPYTVLIGEENKIIAKGLLGKELRDTIADLTKKKKKAAPQENRLEQLEQRAKQLQIPIIHPDTSSEQ